LVNGSGIKEDGDIAVGITDEEVFLPSLLMSWSKLKKSPSSCAKEYRLFTESALIAFLGKKRLEGALHKKELGLAVIQNVFDLPLTQPSVDGDKDCPTSCRGKIKDE
jgi:hypothetical protein